MSQELSKCNVCLKEKQISEFKLKKKYKIKCKECHNKETRKRYYEKKEKLLKEIEEKGPEHVILKCAHCKEQKAASNFNKNFRNCKDCETKVNKKQRIKKMEKQKKEGYSYNFIKKCPKCNVIKQGIEFFKNGIYCIDCNKVILKQEYRKNREKRIKQNSEYRKKRVEQGIEFKTENNLRICKQCNFELPLEMFSICGGNFLQTICNPCRAINNRKYRKEKPYIYKEYLKKNKIALSCRSRIQSLIFKNKRITRDEMFGCSLEQFKNWLQFICNKKGYNFNQCKKEWEIDHVIPCKSFTIEEKEEQIACFHWTNMVPLHFRLNSSKRDKMIFTQIEETHQYLEEFIELHNLDREKEIIYWNDLYLQKIDNQPLNKIRKTFRLNIKPVEETREVKDILREYLNNNDQISASDLVTDC